MSLDGYKAEIEQQPSKEKTQTVEKQETDNFLGQKKILLETYTHGLDQIAKDQFSAILDMMIQDCKKNNRPAEYMTKACEAHKGLNRENSQQNISLFSIPQYFRTFLEKVAKKEQIQKKIVKEEEDISSIKQNITTTNFIKESIENENKINEITKQIQIQQKLYEKIIAESKALDPNQNQVAFTDYKKQTEGRLQDTGYKNLDIQQQQAYLTFGFVLEKIKQLPSNQQTQYNEFITGQTKLNKLLDIPEQPQLDASMMMSVEKPKEISSVQQLTQNPDILSQNTSVQQYANDTKQPSVPFTKLETATTNTEKLSRVRLLSDTERENIRNKIIGTTNILQMATMIDPKTFALKIPIQTPVQEQMRIRDLQQQLLQQADILIINRTNKLTEQTIKRESLVGLVQNFCSYFDITTQRSENFAQDMKIENDDIQFDGTTLIVKGKIRDKAFSFTYNTQTGELMSQDFVHRVLDQKQSKILVGADDNNPQQIGREKVPVILPKLSDRQTDLSRSLDISKLQDHKNLSSYQRELTQQARTYVKDHIRPEPYTQKMIELSMEKNLALQETYAHFPQKINNDVQEENPGMQKLFTTLDKSINYYTPAELRVRRTNLQRLDAVRERYRKEKNQTEKHDPFVATLFSSERIQEDTKQRQNMNYHSGWEQFMKSLTYNTDNPFKKDIVDLKLFSELVTAVEQGKNIENTKLLMQHPNLRATYEEVVDGKDADDAEKKLNEMVV